MNFEGHMLNFWLLRCCLLNTPCKDKGNICPEAHCQDIDFIFLIMFDLSSGGTVGNKFLFAIMIKDCTNCIFILEHEVGTICAFTNIIAQNQSFAQKEIGVKYIDYDYSPTQLFQYFQAFGFNIFTYYIIILFCIFNII